MADSTLRGISVPVGCQSKITITKILADDRESETLMTPSNITHRDYGLLFLFNPLGASAMHGGTEAKVDILPWEGIVLSHARN